MDLVISRFPHIGKNILGNLDKKSLVNCKEVLEEKNIVWIREIGSYINQFPNKQFIESWRLVIQNANSEWIKQLATLLNDSLYKHENQIMYDAYLPKGKRLWSPLHIAVEAGNLYMCKFILGRTKIKNPWDIEHWTPLHSAAKFGHFEIWQMISKWVKNKNPPTKSLKITPLHLAAQSGHLEICEAIMNKVIVKDYSPEDHNGKTPFQLAAEEGHLEVCLAILNKEMNKTRKNNFEIFLEAYCDIMVDKYGIGSLRDLSCDTPLHIAIVLGHLTIVKELEEVKKKERGPENHKVKTPFHLAAEEGHLEECLAILNKQMNKTRAENFEIFLEAYCEIMVDKYYKISHRDFSGDTPLHIAAFKGHLTIVKELSLKQRLSYKRLKGTADFTTLHIAASVGHLEICLEIMKITADKNPRDTRGSTPLHYAAYNGHLKICEAIMEELTNKNPKNNLGLTPMDMAEFTGQTNVVEAIKKMKIGKPRKQKMEMGQ